MVEKIIVKNLRLSNCVVSSVGSSLGLSPAQRRFVASGCGRAAFSSPGARRSLFTPHVNTPRSANAAASGSEVCLFQRVL